MNISLPKELEKIVQEQVDSGVYNNASEVISTAIRQTYCSSEPDPHLDSLAIAEKIRHARQGKYSAHSPGDFDRLFEKVTGKK